MMKRGVHPIRKGGKKPSIPPLLKSEDASSRRKGWVRNGRGAESDRSLATERAYRIRIHSIGGEGGVGASEILAEAIGTMTPFRVLQSPFFGTERSGAPAITYLSFSMGPIRERGTIENPNGIVVFNTKLFSVAPTLLNGFENGEGRLIVNTEEDPSELRGLAREIFCVDATGIAKRLRLGSATFPIPNTAMIGAILKAYEEVLGLKPEDVIKGVEKKVPVKVKENIEAVRAGFESVRRFESPKVVKLRKVPQKDPPFAGISTTLVLSSVEKTGSWATLVPRHRTAMAPCMAHCPAGIDVRRFVNLLAEGRFTEAREVVRNRSPFPSVCGRVCPHFCQLQCNRRFWDGEVRIGQLERFVGDMAEQEKRSSFRRVRRHRIAIVGAGPGGLSAGWDLLRQGYQVKVFEKESEPGGMLIRGIPNYRLPAEVVRREISLLVEAGLEIETGIEVGRDLPYPEMARQFDAIVLALGRQAGRPLQIEGEMEGLQGLMQGIDFLRRSKSGEGTKLLTRSDRVLVIGGGNTAIDVAASALRWLKKLGNETPEVTLCYRRDRAEMPAFQSEVERAEREGIRIRTLLAPKRIISEGSVLRAVEFARCQLGDPDESGRRRPEVVPGSDVLISCDKLILATGQEIRLPFELDPGSLSLKEGRVERFAGPPLFFLEDLGTVAEVIGAGHRIAQAVMETLEKRSEPKAPEEKQEVVRFEDLNLNYFQKKPSVTVKEIPVERSVSSFEEVVQPYSIDEARAEAQRCFSCGACNGCDNCYRYCPDMAVIKQDGRYEVNLDYCKGCLVCFEECPRHAIEVVEVPTQGGKAFWRERVRNFKIIG